jgi:hypothetical protein
MTRRRMVSLRVAHQKGCHNATKTALTSVGRGASVRSRRHPLPPAVWGVTTPSLRDEPLGVGASASGSSGVGGIRDARAQLERR